MADIITGLATDVLKPLASLATTEFLQLYHLKDNVAKLKSTLLQIEVLLENLNVLEGNYELKDRDLIQKLKAAKYDAEDLICSWETECHLWEIKKQVRTFVLPFPVSKLPFKHHISNELQRVAVKLSEIIKEGKEKITNPGSSPTGSSKKKRETVSKQPNVIVGRKREKEEIIELLRDEKTSEGGNVTFIPIVGQGGVGKTFLALLVYNHFDGSDPDASGKHFDVTFWVWVSETFDLELIYKAIVKSHQIKTGTLLNFNVDSLSLNNLHDLVVDILSGKKFLLILDDLWNYDRKKMLDLVDVLCRGDKGSKVLVTSRSEEISKSLKYSKSPIFLQCLDEHQSWSLFEKFAFKEDGELQAFKELGRQIVSECHGLPLVLEAMGLLLCGKPLPEWSNIAKSKIWDDTSGTVLPALRLSYNNLPSRFHRKCFEYMALFPKGYLFEKDELVKLWMAEGYVEAKQGQKAEDIGAQYFNDLSERLLFQCSNLDEGKYKMHDLIIDLAQTVSKPFCRRLIDNERSLFNEDTRHVSLLTKEVEQPALEITRNSKKLRTLLFPVPCQRAFGKAQREVFHSLLYMHVLDMSSSALQTLPDAIAKLKLLRYLDVSKTELKKLPDSICYLYHLQTLKLLGCSYINSLPKKFRFLVHLRHLELDEMFWFKVQGIPQSIGRLTNLHNLHTFQVGCKTGYKLEELKDMEHLTGKLHISNLENAVNAGKEKTSSGEANGPQVNAEEANLKGKKMIDKMVYEWSDSEINLQEDAIEKKVLEDLEPPPGIKELRICHYRGSELSSWMRGGQLQCLVTIVLKDCNKIKILSLGKLPKLEEIRLKNMQDLRELEEEEYKFLTKLTISNCPSLVRLPRWSRRASTWKITKCTKLVSIPFPFPFPFPFGPMCSVTFEDNPVMKHWGEESQLGSFLREYSESYYFSDVKIMNCPALCKLLEKLYTQKLEISGCSSLNALPEENCASFRILALDTCQGDTLLGMIPRSTNLSSLMISNISAVRCLPPFPALSQLETLRIHDCPDLEYLSTPENRLFESFTCLDLLSIKNCPKLVTLPAEGLPTSLQYLSIGPCETLNSFGPPDVLVKLNSLHDLYIEDCPALQSLPNDGLSSSLLHLSIKGCPSLMKNCEEGGSSERQKIEGISDLEIETPSSSSSTPWYSVCCLPGGKRSQVGWRTRCWLSKLV